MAAINFKRNSNQKIAALTACVTGTVEKAAKNELKSGKYPVDLIVRIKGEVSKGEDQERRITAKLPQKNMLLAAIMLNGVSIEAFINRYLSGEFTPTAEQEKELDAIWNKLSATTVGTVSGSVNFAGTVEEITKV
jgi:hypothetical protein